MGPPSRSGHRDPAARELAHEIERAGRDGPAFGHRPEDLELEPVRILGVEREADPVIGLTHQGPHLDQAALGAHQICQLPHLPGGVVHARHALVRRRHPRLLEEAQVMVVGAAGDAQEGRARVPRLHLEAQDVHVEAHAALHVRDPEHEVLEPLEPDAAVAHREASGAPAGYSARTVMTTQARSASPVGARRPPGTARTVTSPCGSSLRTRSTSTDPGSGTPTVTSTSIRPPRARMSWRRGRLEWRMASETARQAAFVPSPPCTSTPMPNSKTSGFALMWLHGSRCGLRCQAVRCI